MHKLLITALTLATLLTSCTKTPPEITVVCEENEVGNCVIKWETNPIIQGQVKVYASISPEGGVESLPLAAAPIADKKMTIIRDNPSVRQYYTLVFDDAYSVKVSTRNLNIPGIQNFRDIGGYKSSLKGKSLKWGMLYRSAQFDSLCSFAKKELNAIGIRTVIDLRPNSEVQEHPGSIPGARIVHIPIPIYNILNTIKNIQLGKVKSDTIDRYLKRINKDMINTYKAQYRQVFEVLLNTANYPIVIQCASGKIRGGIVSALILAAMNVNKDLIYQDYCSSNNYYNIASASKYAYKLPACSQEAITSVYTAKEEYLQAAQQEIERVYGDVSVYLEKGLGLSPDKIKRLRNILLEDS